MNIRRGLATTVTVCALVVGAAACSDDGDKGGKGPFQGKPGGEQSTTGGSEGAIGGDPQQPGPGEQKPNGVDRLAAPEIFRKAMDSLGAANAVRITSTGEDTTMDLALDKDGNCAGSVGSEQAKIEIMRNGSSTWLKPSASFWETQLGPSASQVTQVIGDRYVKVDPNDPQFSQFTEVCDLDEITDTINQETDGASGAQKGQPTEVDGTPAIEISESTADGRGSMLVSTVGKPYPLKVSMEAGNGPTTMTFSDYDKPLGIQAPDPDDVLDAQQLAQLLGQRP